MGGSDSKPIEDTDTQNNGILNGNLINNGQIIEKIDTDIVRENYLLLLLIILKFIHILIVVIKWFKKYVRKQHQHEQELRQIIVEKNRNPQ